MHINVEKIHSRWLNDLSSFAVSYLRKRGGKEQEGAVIHLPADPELKEYGPYLKANGKFSLPPGSGDLILEMARFSKCTFKEVLGVRNLGEEPINVPEKMFCLHSLLLASFPKNIETNTFKAHDGADFDPEDVGLTSHHPYNAFCGLGVILLNETRKILSPISPDAEIMTMADGLFFGILEKG